MTWSEARLLKIACAAVLGEASECEIYTGQTSILDRVEDRHKAHDREDNRNIRLSGKVVLGFSGVSSVTAITPFCMQLRCQRWRSPYNVEAKDTPECA